MSVIVHLLPILQTFHCRVGHGKVLWTKHAAKVQQRKQGFVSYKRKLTSLLRGFRGMFRAVSAQSKAPSTAKRSTSKYELIDETKFLTECLQLGWVVSDTAQTIADLRQ